MGASIQTIKGMCRKLLDNPETSKLAVISWGPPGIGKTDAFQQLAAEMNAEFRAFLCATMDPTDVVGVPHPIGGVTQFLPPQAFFDLTDKAEYTGPMVACFDDMPAGNEAVFNSLLRFFHNRDVAGSKVRDNVFLCATGNRAEDRANARDLGTALNNRFLHVEVDIKNEEWREWAIQNGVPKEIIGYIGARPEKLHQFDPEENIREFPTPRSVTNAGKVQDALGLDDPHLFVAMAGLCGASWAMEYEAFLRNTAFAVKPEEIVKDPENCKVPDESDIDVTHATISSLTYFLNQHCKTEAAKTEKVSGYVKAGLTYASRLPTIEFGIVLARDLFRGIIANLEDMQLRAAICDSGEFDKVHKKFNKYLI